jgi:hypothetical protein
MPPPVVGTAVYDEDLRVWRIRAEPHVMMRLKRVFGRIAQNAFGEVRLSATEENCRELAWFTQRFAFDVDRPDILQERAETHRGREDALAGILSTDHVPPPFHTLALPAREYQRLAAEMVLRNGSLLLADDVGLGKTASSICVLTEANALPALVVTLAHLPRQWEAEIKKFAPHLTTHVVKKGTPYDLTKAPRGSKAPNRFPDVILLNYHKLAGWADTLAEKVKTVIYDEAQELRHAGTNKHAAARHISSATTYRMGLTATPIYNYGGEIYNVIDSIRPDSLGTHEEFMREWCIDWGYGARPGDKPKIRDPKAFGTYVRRSGLMLRRTRAEVGRELPALTRAIHHVDADEEALDRVGGSAAELARIILKQGESKQGEKFLASEEFNNILRQATGIAKAPYVADFVRLLIESGEKVVLYGWHREVYSLWMHRLADLSPVMYTGSESSAQKDESKRKFLADESPLLIISLRAGAGLDGLQHKCRTVVFGELDWSPGVHEQCVGRVYRDGQPEPVLAYFLLSETGSDPVVADTLGLKKQQIDGLRDPSADIVETLEADPDRIKKLAEAFLKQRGIALPPSGP